MLLLILLFLSNGGGVLGADEKITSASELISFATKVLGGSTYEGTTVYLENDVDFSSLSTQFKPIGDSSNPFRGTFDGQGHKISNLKFSSSSYRHAGFFGYSQGTTIRNLVIDGTCSFASSASTTSSGYNAFAGGVIGCCDAEKGSCIFENNVNMAPVTFSGSSGKWMFLGGIGGMFCPTQSNLDIAIRNCINYGAITFSGTSTGYSHIGGIAGELTYPSNTLTTPTKHLQNCINYGTVTSTGTALNNEPFVGGVVGTTSNPVQVENCVSVGKVTKSSSTSTLYIGGVVGYVLRGSTISHCYWTSDVGYDKLYGYKYTETGDTLSTTNSNKITINAASVSVLNSYGSWNTWALNTNKASVTFRVNRGAGYTFTASSQLILLPSLVGSSGRTFSGWYTDPSCTSKFTGTSFSGVTTLYGGWTYTVTFNGNGGTSSQPSKSVVYGQLYGTLPDATREGYTLTGWYSATSGGTKVEAGTTVTIASNHNLYAHWKANEYTVTFNGNGGTPSQKTMGVTYDNAYGTLPSATREGYTFLGWYTELSGGTKIEAGTTKVSTAKNHNLYAQWKVNNYTITFNGNGGTPSQTAMNATYDSAYGTLPDATREGYSFLGWYTATTGGTKIEVGTTVTTANNHVLYAQWEGDRYTVTFNATGGIPSQTSMNVTYDEVYKELPDVTREGHTFLGWYTDISGGYKIEQNESIVNISEDHTLYAQWVINNYTVTFNIDNETLIEVEYQFNDTIVPLSDPKRDGYTFLGWDSNITTMPDHNITVNAMWDKITEYVEIVINTKDLSQKEIEDIIRQYTDSDFTIVEYENQSDEMKVIIKFNDKKSAESFVESISISSEDLLKSVRFISDEIRSFSPTLYPMYLSIIF